MIVATPDLLIVAVHNALFPLSVADLIGNEYTELRATIKEATQIRNKIFHGQISDQCLQREDLIVLSNDIRRWCELLATAAARETGYDGFARHSYQKRRAGLANRYRLRLGSVDEYIEFLVAHVARR